MKSSFVSKIVALAVTGASLSVIPAFAGSDAFNRPKIGKQWVAVSGSIGISNREFVGSTLSLSYQKTSASNTAATAVIRLGSSDVEYGAIALGNIAGGNNAFIKLQSQNGSGTTFDTAGFCTGNNNDVDFFLLPTPVPSPAVVDAFFCGTTATMRITSAAGIQAYTFNYGTAYPSGAGLGTYGLVGLDNFIGFASACTDVVEGAVDAATMPKATDLSLAK